MPLSPEVEERALADHEAGHLVVSAIVGLSIEKVSLDAINGVRGCFYTSVGNEDLDDFRYYLCLLAGPRAQVELCPESLTEDQRVLFVATINQPQQSIWEIPAVYDFTGWGPDMNTLYTYLAFSTAPAAGLAWGIRRRDVIERVEVRLKKFFIDVERRKRCRQVADVLKQQRLLQGAEATALVTQHFDLVASRALLSWAAC